MGWGGGPSCPLEETRRSVQVETRIRRPCLALLVRDGTVSASGCPAAAEGGLGQLSCLLEACLGTLNTPLAPCLVSSLAPALPQKLQMSPIVPSGLQSPAVMEPVDSFLGPLGDPCLLPNGGIQLCSTDDFDLIEMGKAL